MPKGLQVGVSLFVLFAAWIVGLGKSLAYQSPEATVTPSSRPYITVTYVEPINVRGGPNSVYYPIVGSLPVGAVAEAVGRSPGGEWIKIVYPDAADGSGTGWVYAPLVKLSPGFLPIVQPPPTAVPLYRPTLNPAFVASLQPSPTQTRLPTFTFPAPLVIPTYQNQTDGRGGSTGFVIVLLAVLGVVGLWLSARLGRG
ncbi:MAG: SH3 domain-containing protein [Anaerolineales bacterium]|nr:SH3 domain-containing protein [Anaerolineales bacterium]